MKLKGSRRKEVMKIRAEIKQKPNNAAETKIYETRSLFFVKIIKIDKPLAKHTNKK